MSIRRRLRPFVITFFFLVFVLIVELFTMPNAWPIFHQNVQGLAPGQFIGKVYDRVRLTTTESSLTVPLIVTFGSLTVLYFYLLDKRWKLYLTVVCILLFYVTSTARTILIFLVAFLGFLAFEIITERKKRFKWMLMIIPVFILFPLLTIWIVPFLNEKIFMQSYGSLATRGSSLMAAIIHMFRYPLGMGNSVSILTMSEITKNVAEWLSKHFANLNFYELNVYLTSNKERISAYGALSYSLYWGLPGTVYLYYGIIKLYKSYSRSCPISRYIAAVFWGYNVIMTLTVPLNNCYPFWGFLAIFALFESDEKKSKNSLFERNLSFIQ